MSGRRGRIAIVLGPLLALLLLLVARQAPVPVGDVSDGPVGAVPAFADRAVVAGCPGSNEMVGSCGTVAGFAGWYGSWKTAGVAGAFCLEHAKKEPLASLEYSKYATAVGHTSMTAEDRARVGYLLGRYAGTADATKAAALAILVHAAEGDTLTTDQLASYPTSLTDGVRSTAVALWAEAGDDHGPYAADVTVVADAAGAKATVTVRSAAGHPMAGYPVSWAGSSHGGEVTTTGGSGMATLTVATVVPGNTVTAKAAVGGLPAADLAVWVPKDSTVQSVAVALPALTVSAAGSFAAAQAPASLQILKTTDDPGYASPEGAVFSVTDAGGSQARLTAGADGATNTVGGLVASAGPFTITETQPCPGCATAPPQQVTLNPGQAAVVTIQDAAIPQLLAIRKVTPDGQGLAGALLHLRRASQPGGTFDTDLGTCTSQPDGSCPMPGQGALPPADYQVTEDAPAPGTGWAVPHVQVVKLRQTAGTVTFTDPRLTTVGFTKTDSADGSTVEHSHESLAGAVFAVTGPAAPTATGADPATVELGRCTTGAAATCGIPGTPLIEGGGYTWTEVTAPPGFALDAARHPFTACVAPCDQASIPAGDQGRYAHVTLVKHVAGDVATPVTGATIDLCAAGLPDALTKTFTAPVGQACAPAATWVASGSTDAHGGIDFGLLPPGTHYCAVERSAPEGFELNATPVCGDLGAAGSLTDAPPVALVLDLAEQRTPPAPTAPSLAPSTSAAPVPAPSIKVLAVRKAKPSSRPKVGPARVTLRPSSPPSVPTRRVLAYTGTEDVGSTLELGGGLISLGLALLTGATAARRRRG